MYLEGLVVASFAGAMSQTSKVMWPLLLIFWPIALPILAYKTYVKYQPVIQQIQENPLMGSLLGLNRTMDPENPPANPLANLSAPTVPPFPKDQPNPFLTGFLTRAADLTGAGPLSVEIIEDGSTPIEKLDKLDKLTKSHEGEQS